ncbi:hypothetical protein P4N68_05670 [Corynebacterium felinum]|uniref:DNA-binding transcriptional regulator of glucitol operon n=1 Tax=Corynebacterium felinum TaxID=131318 RepID=A0ABU2B4X8_9CORY|nr:hypothetical protein [Corynebacterium felinum]MDF5820569.1 hypothetical protein [Corynebacterium felinum]MDR7353662.1 DNA-binding transcriptional regulator of glucitol operon [Corynebacterium felinum]WJY95841.1 hypothetical protein CFELI_11250 [Corynebacterium felinum]
MSKNSAPSPKLRVKVWHILFLGVLVSCTIALAWWQWTRFQSGSGTFQNLGYAFQWPFFGLFFVYTYRKILQYENEKAAAEVEGQTYVSVPEAQTPVEIDEGFLPERTQLTVEEFNERNRPTRRRNSK